ncbi:MAG: DegQ family serine endoprotease [Pyrinomonadaceae bacterium]
MLKFKLFVIISILAAAASSACRTNLLGGEELPGVPAAQPVPQAAPVASDGYRTSYADVVEKSSAAVIRIEVEHKNQPKQQPGQQSPLDDFFRQFPVPQQEQGPRIERGVGSGVIVNSDGTILTNAHVIDGAERIKVLLNDNKTFEAKLVGTDKPSDLAVLKIESQDLPFLTLGNSDNVRVGDIVLAIGNPLGIGQSVTAGIISAKGRRTGLSYGNSNDSYEDFLQTDAPINRGNSGGALVNLNSELIGINSQILSSPGSAGGNIGIGFSIPSNMAKSVMEQLIRDGRVRRGMLGINIQNLTEDTAKALELADASGIIISNVRPGSSADKAGLKRGDIVTAINGEKIEDTNVLRNKVAGTLPGTEIRLTILRDGNPQELTATLDEYNSEGEPKEGRSDKPETAPNTQKEEGDGKLGLSLQPVSPEIAGQLDLPPDSGGLIVTNVDQNGPAAAEGIARGDVVLEVNRQPVKTIEEVRSALEKSGDRPILLLVNRRGQTIYLTVRPD